MSLMNSLIIPKFNKRAKSTIQIYYTKDNLLYPTGCGLLISINQLYNKKHYFLVTAAHVVDEDLEYCIIASGHMDCFYGNRFKKTALPPSNLRKDDKLDIAALKLSNSYAEKLISNGYSFLSSVDSEPRPYRETGIYMTLGFIANRTKIRFGEIEAESFTYATSYNSTVNYEKYGLDLTYNIAVDFDKMNIYSEKRDSPHIAPKLNGISGSGLWLVAIQQHNAIIPIPNKENSFLAGIITEQIQYPNEKVFIATRARYIYKFLIEKFSLTKFSKPPYV